jgi:hypothetical protein
MSHFAGEHDDNHICEGFVNPACPEQRLAPGVPTDEIRRFICEYCGAPPATLLPRSRARRQSGDESRIFCRFYSRSAADRGSRVGFFAHIST